MNSKPEPNWHPIESLSMIANLIDGQLADVKEQYATLLEARSKPHVLNDAIVERTIKVYTEQLDFTWVFEKQLSKWKNEERLIPDQQTEIDRLLDQMKILNKVLVDILALSEELKLGTIEKVLAKSDLELGIEFLQRNF